MPVFIRQPAWSGKGRPVGVNGEGKAEKGTEEEVGYGIGKLRREGGWEIGREEIKEKERKMRKERGRRVVLS